MDSGNVLRKIKNIILDAREDLVLELRHQDVDREIKQVTTSTLTPPREFYTVLVTISSSEEFDQVVGANMPINMRKPPAQRRSRYNVEITVGDEAVMQYTDADLDDAEFFEPFEKMDEDFQLLVNRMAKLILDSDVKGNIRLDNNRTIAQFNESYTWDEAERFHAMLYAQLRFTVVEECADNSLSPC